MATLSCKNSQWAYYEYSYSTRKDSNNVYFDLSLTFKSSVDGGVQTQEAPGWMTWIAPNWSFTANASNTIATPGGKPMRDAVEAAEGVCAYWPTAEKFVSYPKGDLYTHNLTLTLKRTDEDRDVTVYFGVAVQSSYYWSMFSSSSEPTVTVSVPAAYTAPESPSISLDSNTSTSIKIKATWTNGSNPDKESVTAKTGDKSVTISTKDGTGEFTELTPNTVYVITGSLTHEKGEIATNELKVLTDIVSPSSWTTATSNTNSITVAATSSNGGNFKYQYRIQKNGSWSDWQDSGTFGSLSSNTNYPLQARCINTDNSKTSGTLDGSMWTYPVINTPSLSLKSGSEHNTINVSVSASVASNYDQFAYKLGSGSWSSYTTSKSYSFGSLSGYTTYTIYVKMKNTSSGYESAEASASITTWYNPLTGLTVNLVNRWFWYLQINCSYSYSGTITKYEFAIGDDQAWQTKSGNSHSRGSINPGASGNLVYNTDYGCWVKLTDNHGRTYSYTGQGTTYEFANARKVFKTLDERPLYVNGALREVKVIKPDGSVHYITPNLLTVVKPDGSTTNMNKIINNDNRTSYQ